MKRHESIALIVSIAIHVVLLAGLTLPRFSPSVTDEIRISLVPEITEVAQEIIEIEEYQPEQIIEEVIPQSPVVEEEADETLITADEESILTDVPLIDETIEGSAGADDKPSGELSDVPEGDGTPAQGIADEPEIDVEQDNAGIDLDAIRSDYSSRVLAAISVHKVYPAQARRLGQEGIVRVRFNVTSDGTVTDVQVEESSGFQSLDNAAVDAVIASSPVPAVPSELGASVLTLSLLIVFDLD